jgi:starch phosphorylase
MLERGDAYFHLADLPAYIDAQRQVDDVFREPPTWGSKAILNVARIGRFSSDRTVAEYARDIWGIVGC